MLNQPLQPQTVKEVFCNDFPGCLRIASDGLNFIVENVVHLFLSLFYSNFKSIYILNDLALSQWYTIISELIFKTLMLLPFYYWVSKQYRNNLISKIVIVLSLGLIITGFPLSFIHTYFGVYFTKPDYAVFFIIGTFLLRYQKFNFFSSILFIFSASLFFEHLGIISLISLYFLRNDLFTNLIKNAIYISSAFIGPVSILLINYMLDDNFYYIGFGNIYFHDNVKYFLRTFLALLAIFGKSFLLALLSLKISPTLYFNLVKFHRVLKVLLNCFLLTYLIGFFNSGISHEGARQTMAGQVLLYFFCITFIGKKLGDEKQKIKNVNQ